MSNNRYSSHTMDEKAREHEALNDQFLNERIGYMNNPMHAELSNYKGNCYVFKMPTENYYD